MHMVKYQSLMCPNGIVCQLDGHYQGSWHDARIFRESRVYTKLERLTGNEDFVVYGDPAYPLRPLLMKPYGASHLSPAQQAFNCGISAVREAVEWGFGKVVAEFAFLDFKKNQKLLWQQVAAMYKVATILSNCHTAIYGSQVSSYFSLQRPQLREYLKPCP
uniref:DDE Tnp4 domain-containing protein n=1 Tax=Rhipicephalus appendiculatus TaxID=34631 RepID=A0A131Z5L6_RHIAP